MNEPKAFGVRFLGGFLSAFGSFFVYGINKELSP
jgi:hypothetical protein